MATSTFHSRLRSNSNLHDPYQGLAASKYPVIQCEEEYWSNGTTTLLSRMPSSLAGRLSSSTNVSISKTQSVSSVPAITPQVLNVSKPSSLPRPTERIRKHEVRNSIIAGSFAGVASCVLFHPFDVVRTKMQASTKVFETAAERALSGTATSRGPLDVLMHTFKNGGLRAMYTGVTLPLAAQAAYKSTVLTVNRITKSSLIEYRSREQRKIAIFSQYDMRYPDFFVCGSISGAVNALIFVSPVEFVRNQLIAQHTRIAQAKALSKPIDPMKIMNGPLDLVKRTLRTVGPSGLWRGATVTIVRDSLGCGSFFVMFEVGERNLPRFTGQERGAFVNTIGSGLMAGFGYWFTSLPLDSLKTLVQTGKAPSATATVSLLIRRDGFFMGIKQLYRGWQLAFSRGSPSAAVTLTTYSAIYSFCDKGLS